MRKINNLKRRHIRLRKKVIGSKEKPRLSVYRSNKSLYVQLIDDDKKITLLGMKDTVLKTKGTKTEKAKALGLEFGKQIKAKKVKKIVFDRGGNRYHGRIKAFAEGVRESGLIF